MKKRITALALFSTVLLAGCATETTEETTEESSSSIVESESTTEESQTESSTESEESNDEAAEETAVAYQYQVNPSNYAIEPIEDETSEEKIALLTIDDAPDKYSVEMAHKLKEIDAPAIFFVNGMYIESDEGKEALKEIHDLGFEIGNHTQTHPNLQTISTEEQKAEILETNALIEEVIGEKPRFFRAPHGANTDVSRQLVADEGMTLMNWTFGYDFQPDYQDADALLDITMNTELLYNGANILMHDREWTNQAIVPIAEGLREQEFTLIDPKLIVSPESEEE
ncbi:polysaccharide deacetylase family protein [Desemzia sp. FAM 23991]|uniref:polysaccharide deacetylase family protein n=1 Tax=unclassified Desemzia TaxID=2685243 RepID=UPI0038888347